MTEQEVCPRCEIEDSSETLRTFGCCRVCLFNDGFKKMPIPGQDNQVLFENALGLSVHEAHFIRSNPEIHEVGNFLNLFQLQMSRYDCSGYAALQDSLGNIRRIKVAMGHLPMSTNEKSALLSELKTVINEKLVDLNSARQQNNISPMFTDGENDTSEMEMFDLAETVMDFLSEKGEVRKLLTLDLE